MQPLETGNPPYYIVPDVELYKKLDPQSEEAQSLARKIAVNIGDLPTLRLILGIDPPEFARFYPDMEPATPDTFDAIDTFLDKFGAPSESPSLSNLISEHKYQQALQLIESQNLNNPQKSIYFAHQMRFLKKLIAIEKYKKQQSL